MQQLLLLTGAIIEIIAFLVYIKAILKGEAKPHRTTRLVILIIATIATFSLFAQGSQTAFWLLFINAIFGLLVFILSLKFGMGGWSKLDILCLFIAILGIILWRVSDDPALALYSAVAADFTGFLPTLIKAYKFPKSEVWYFFFMAATSAGLNFLSTKNWTFQEILYPSYLVLVNLYIVYLIRTRP